MLKPNGAVGGVVQPIGAAEQVEYDTIAGTQRSATAEATSWSVEPEEVWAESGPDNKCHRMIFGIAHDIRGRSLALNGFGVPEYLDGFSTSNGGIPAKDMREAEENAGLAASARRRR